MDFLLISQVISNNHLFITNSQRLVFLCRN
jgi:hypothetical protein